MRTLEAVVDISGAQKPLLSNSAPAVQPLALRGLLMHSEGDPNAGLEWRIYCCIVHQYARRVITRWKFTNEAGVKRWVLGPGRDSIVESCKDFVSVQECKSDAGAVVAIPEYGPTFFDLRIALDS